MTTLSSDHFGHPLPHRSDNSNSAEIQTETNRSDISVHVSAPEPSQQEMKGAVEIGPAKLAGG